jgi:N-acetylneuraminic acid mutarotase
VDKGSEDTRTIWYEMTPGSNVAATKADFPGPKRASAKSFTINDKFYFGWGWSSSGYKDDFWEYNPSNNTWTQKTSCPVSNVDESNINVFSIGNAGYLVKGDLGSFYRYSSVSLTPVP